MGNDKEDTGFGFKDKQKALDTLKLLEEHDMNYRRLTVRGLLGRAKRVLSLTKAEEKIKNIKEAMEVFENWLAELDASKNKDGDKKSESKKEKKDEKKEDKKVEKMDEDVDEKTPTDTVPGLGFKDRAAAEGTLVELEGRDPDYQKLAVKGLIGRANRVLTCTKDETKVSNIKEAVTIFEKFLDDFDTKHLSRQNNAYIALGVVRTCLKEAEDRGLNVDKQKAFIAAYASVNGEYKKLRTVKEKDDAKSWDIVRNVALKGLKEKYANAKLFNDKDEPTDEHLQLLLWAYSPEAAKVKKVIKETDEESKKDSRKRKSSVEDESPSKKKRDD